MKSRIFGFLLSVCMLVSAFGLSACTPSQEDCEHEYGKWKITTDPTCTEEGQRERVCDICEYVDTQKMDPKGHNEYTLKGTEATCLEAGITEGKMCTVCEENIVPQEEIAALDHDYTVETEREASCQRNGLEITTCKRCGDNFETEIEFPKYDATEIHEMAKKAVVEIHTFDRNGNGISLGSGFIYSTNGKVITNYHVIEGAYSAKAILNGNTFNVKTVVAYGELGGRDLAILQLDTISTFEPLKICEEDHPTGATVYALGSSESFTDTFSRGIITNNKRVINNMNTVQHDAAISHGNSGGPLLNEYGEVIGVNTWGWSEGQNINFAIYVSELKKLKTVNLSFADFYKATMNPFELMADYIVAKGEYDYGYSLVLKKNNITSRTAYYDPDDTETPLDITRHNNQTGQMFWVDLPVSGGDPTWTYLDTDTWESAEGYVSESGELFYTSFDVSAENEVDFANFCIESYSLISNNIATDFAEIGITAEDIGLPKPKS